MRNSAWQIAIAALLLATLSTSDLRADIFVLENDGRVQGTLANPKESPRKKYIVKIDDGASLTLDKSQVKDHISQSPDELEYEKLRFTFLDSVEGQWKAAEWCRERGLTRERNAHLERVIELDMNHKEARAALGYGQINGRWVRQEDVMKARGYVLHKGRWLLPQDVALQEQKEQAEIGEKEWYNKVRRFRGLIGDRGPKGQAALEEFRAITDPNAVRPLIQWFDKEQSEAVSLEIIKVLGRIERGDAVRSLCLIALDGATEELRLSAIDELKRINESNQLKRINDRAAVTMLVQGLRGKDNKRHQPRRAGSRRARRQDRDRSAHRFLGHRSQAHRPARRRRAQQHQHRLRFHGRHQLWNRLQDGRGSQQHLQPGCARRARKTCRRRRRFRLRHQGLATLARRPEEAAR